LRFRTDDTHEKEGIMHCRTCRTAIGLRVFLATTAILHLAAAPAHACLGGYRGADWQVGNSPLILIGTIEKVEAGKVANVERYRAPFDSSGESHATPPTIATVRIMRILKGKYADAHIRIGSGPIHSACDVDWFYTFKVGEQKIFILPYYPVEREVAVEWAGSIRELADTSMIESRIHRAVTFRDAYLADLQREQPKVYAAGMRLAEEIRNAAKTWPDDDRDAKTGERSAACKKALAALQEKLSKEDVEAIRAALAVDWLADDSGQWWRKWLWREALSKTEALQLQKVKAAENQWIRKTLAAAGVEKEHIDKYLASLSKSQWRGVLCFPHETPTDWGFFHHDRAVDAEILTTDLILRCQSYDRCAMLHAYAGALDASVLANIDPKRAKPWVDSLYRNDDGRLRWIAEQIIKQIPAWSK
jgi:hypothetical protein